MTCPRCGSSNVYINSDYGRIHASNRSRSWLLPLIQLVLRNILYAMRDKYRAQCKCVVCGHKWFAKRGALEQKYRGHLTAVMGECSEMNFAAPNGASLRLNEQGVTIYHSPKRAFPIPYDQITAVDYKENLGPLYGWLCVRHVGNRKKPFPKTFTEAQKDKTTIFYHLDNSANYRKVYIALKSIAEENKKAGMF